MSTSSNNTLPPEIQLLVNALVARNEKLQQLVEELTARCEKQAKLIEQLTHDKNRNSSNSNKPPSTDNIKDRRSIRPPKTPTGKKRGGQPGHKGSFRQLLDASQVDRFIDLFPEHCEVCQEAPPKTPSTKPWRHQVVDLQANGGRFVEEYRCHAVRCMCGEFVAAPIEKAPSSSFGARLSSTVATLTGNFHMSRRQVVVFLHELFDISISLGSVSNLEGRMSEALSSASDEAMDSAASANTKHVDETGWVRDFERCSAWVFATRLVSVFRIVGDGSRKSLRRVFKRQRGILVSDRAWVFLYWKMARRQICWSHLQRLFIDFAERTGTAARFGRELLDSAKLVFIYWRQHQAKTITRAKMVQLLVAVRDGMKPCLERAARAAIAGVSGACKNLLEHWEAMWTFLAHKEVEPTNNHAERELRRLVLWRKRCFGSQSERGDRYVERMLTVTHTMRKQRRNVLDFFQQSFEAWRNHTPAPRMLTV